MQPKKLMQRIAAGYHANVRFKDFVRLVEAFGFVLTRIRGSHRTFVHPIMGCALELQPSGHDAKKYQIRQLLKLVAEYDLKLQEE